MDHSLSRYGYTLLTDVLDRGQIAHAAQRLGRLVDSEHTGVLRTRGHAYGVRNLLQLWPEVLDLVRLPKVLDFLHQTLGDSLGVVRALLFDKPPGCSWTLPWHRDRTIAVRQIPAELSDFQNPTLKAGIPHLVAPSWLLANMLTLRFSLDPMRQDNGPLTVLPGSHLSHTDDHDLEQITRSSITTILCEAGDVFVMRPLLAHSSLKSDTTTRLHRRVVHVELCPHGLLPPGLDWYEFALV